MIVTRRGSQGLLVFTCYGCKEEFLSSWSKDSLQNMACHVLVLLENLRAGLSIIIGGGGGEVRMACLPSKPAHQSSISVEDGFPYAVNVLCRHKSSMCSEKLRTRTTSLRRSIRANWCLPVLITLHCRKGPRQIRESGTLLDGNSYGNLNI